MDEPKKKIGADYFKKLRQRLRLQKKEFEGVKFNINYVRAKPNVAKPFERPPQLCIPYLDHKFALMFGNKSSAPVNTQSNEPQAADRRPKRKVEPYVNLPPDFFGEKFVPNNFSIFEPEVQIAESSRSVALSNSTIFDPPVTSTPFGAMVEDERPRLQAEPAKKTGADYLAKFRQQLREPPEGLKRPKRKVEPYINLPPGFFNEKPQEVIERPSRNLEPFGNIPSDFFSEKSVAPQIFDLSIFETAGRNMDIDRSIATANSTIFNPPKTSTPFGAFAEDNGQKQQVLSLVSSPPEAVAQFNRNRRPERTNEKRQELAAYKKFVEAIAAASAAADKQIFGDTSSVCHKDKEYLQKVSNHTAPSPAPNPTPAVKKSYFTKSSIPICTPSPAAPVQTAGSETLFGSPTVQPWIFSQLGPQSQLREDPFLFDTTNAFGNRQPAQVPLNQDQEMTLFGTPGSALVQQRKFDTYDVFNGPNEALDLFGTPSSQAMQHPFMDTFEETFDRNLSGYQKMMPPCTPPNYTQFLNDETVEFQYQPRNMLDRRNQFVVRRKMPQDYY